MKTLLLVILVIAGATFITGFPQQSRSTTSLEYVAPGFGGISGYVFAPDGKPLANAEVCAEALDNAPFVGRMPRSSTDEDGKFFISNARPGSNRVYAFKEEDGYPDPSFSIYRDASTPPPQVVVRKGDITRGVIVHLGRKCEKLLVSVIDADTHNPIKRATITIYSANNLSIRSSSASDAKGKFEILLPRVPARLKVMADGYEEASDLNVHALSESVHAQVATGKANEVTVLLRRAK